MAKLITMGAVIDFVGPSDGEPQCVYHEAVFRNLIDRDSGRIVQNLDLHRCSFINCRLSSGLDPANRTTFRRVQLSHCRIQQRLGLVGAPILEDILVDDFRCGDVLIFSGAAFRRVTLKGHMPPMILNERMAGGAVPVECAELFVAANREYYKSVDWALDIRDARFASVRLSSVPGQLIRRNPETQVLVSRSKLLQTDWNNPALPSITRVSLRNVVNSRHEYQVIVAGERSNTFPAQLKGFDILRREGLVLDS